MLKKRYTRHSRVGGNPYSHHEAHEETKRENKTSIVIPAPPQGVLPAFGIYLKTRNYTFNTMQKKYRHSRVGGNPYLHHEAHKKTKSAGMTAKYNHA